MSHFVYQFTLQLCYDICTVNKRLDCFTLDIPLKVIKQELKGSTNIKLQKRLPMRDEIKNKTITMTTLFTETLVIFLVHTSTIKSFVHAHLHWIQYMKRWTFKTTVLIILIQV